MADFANSNNQSASMKESYPKKKKRQRFADGGPVATDAPADFISDEQFNSMQGAQPVQLPPADPGLAKAQVANGSLNAANPMGSANLNATNDLYQMNPKSPVTHETPDFIPDDQFVSDDDKYGTAGQMAKTALEGVGQGIAGPLAPMAEEALGVDPNDIRLRAETNPLTHTGSEIAGFAGSMMTGVGEGAMVAKAGEAALGTAKALGIASKMGLGASRLAAESALQSAGDEVTKYIVQDPNQSIQTAAIDVGLSGLIGGAGGALIGGVSGLWKATAGNKLEQTIADFKGRISQHLETPDPVDAVGKELSDHYTAIKSMADDVYGTSGLKAQDIAKAMPKDITNEMMAQSNQIATDLNASIKKMAAKPQVYPERLSLKLQGDLDAYQAAVTRDNVTPGDIFNAGQELKQQLQGYSKFDKFVKPVDEAYDFVKDAKGLAYNMRNALEDSGVWGQAADRQKAINKAFVQFKPALEDFERKFTSEVSGERQIDPGKIATYLNQLGKPSAEIKQDMLRNFLGAADKYKGVINETHANLGIDNPLPSTSLDATYRTLDKPTTGAKLADIFIEKGLSEGGGRSLGAAAGAAAGHLVGAPEVGALIGNHALGNFFSSILPALAKPFLAEQAKGSAAKAAIDYSASVAKGMMMMQKGAKSLFKASGDILPQSMVPSAKEIMGLDKQLQSFQVNPEKMVHSDNPLGHYMPEHQIAQSQTTATASNYLNSLRPVSAPKAPLDKIAPVEPGAKAKYERQLSLAQQPMQILQRIKDGTINAQDLKTVSTIYPQLYKNMVMELTDAMTGHLGKGGEVPYKTRIGLSLFMGQAMDSTMSQASIMAAQPIPTAPPQAPQGQKGGHQLSKVGDKTTKMAMTQAQSAEQDEIARKHQ